MPAPNVYILAKSGEDEFTIVGIYTDEARAQTERIRVEALLNDHDTGKRRIHRGRKDRELLEVLSYPLDETLAYVMVDMRKDGEVVWRGVSLGRSLQQDFAREPSYRGNGITPEAAEDDARQRAST